MTEYDGLNLPQLMELMHRFVQPDPVAMTPQTIGWAITAGWLLLLTGILGHAWWRQRRANRYRRDALRLLHEIAEFPGAEQSAAIAELIKRTAIAAYGRQRTASLTGPAWADFLVQTANHDPEVETGAQALAQAAYRPSSDAKTLLASARRWIQVHRA